MTAAGMSRSGSKIVDPSIDTNLPAWRMGFGVSSLRHRLSVLFEWNESEQDTFEIRTGIRPAVQPSVHSCLAHCSDRSHLIQTHRSDKHNCEKPSRCKIMAPFCHLYKLGNSPKRFRILDRFGSQSSPERWVSQHSGPIRCFRMEQYQRGRGRL